MVYVLTALVALSLLLMLQYLVLVLAYGRRRVAPARIPGSFPKVSVLKPLSGLDDRLEENLHSFFESDYPDFEIIVSVDGDHSRCLPLLDGMLRRYPHVPARVIVTSPVPHRNPKIGSLMASEPYCRGTLYWITDANVRVEKSTLRNMVHEHADNGAAMVFSLIRGTGSATIGSILENSFHNAFSSPAVLFAWRYLKKPVTIGKSLLVEKAALEKAGGFRAFQEYLSEDLMMGRSFVRHGLKVSTGYSWVANVNCTGSLRRFWSRADRWSKMRFRLNNVFYYSLELLAHPLLLAAAAVPFLGRAGGYVFAAVLVLKLAYEYAVLKVLAPEDARKPWVLAVYPFGVVLRDLLVFALFWMPFFGTTLSWRGRHMTIGYDSRIVVPDRPGRDVG